MYVHCFGLRSRNHCSHEKARIRLTWIVVVYVAVKNMKVLAVFVYTKKFFLLHRCRATKYFVLLRSIIDTQYDACVCILAFVIQHANRMFSAMSFHVWIVWLYQTFSHYLTDVLTFGKNILNMKYVFWFSLQTLSEICLILQRDIVISILRSPCTVPFILALC
jgi:hypothetical protein